MISILLLLPLLALAQTPPGFQEISPEREKQLKELALREKKRKETEAYTKWLISERDRKMKVAEAEAIAEAKAKAEAKERAQAKAMAQAKAKTIMNAQAKVEPQTENVSGGQKNSGSVLQACDFRNVKFPPETKVIGIGTYEGTVPGGRGFRKHPMVPVIVNIKSSQPVVVVAKTYEPIRWDIRSKGKVLGVLVMGYHMQEVIVDQKVPIVVSTYEGKENCGPYRDTPHEISHEAFSKIVASEKARQLTGKDLSEFMYSYTLPPEIEVGEN